jgi:broad specificity phosphatase PhoE
VALARWPSGPTTLTLVRHGESLGNLASRAADRSGAERLDLDERDADVELSDTGREQADAIAHWLDAEAPEEWRPSVVVCSPYRRAAETAERALADTGLEATYDERLRERDLGRFDGLTSAGIRIRHPEEAQRRRKLGKFYYQPPGGESWADVVLRVRSLLADLRHGYDGEAVWMFTHQAVIMSFRAALEGLSEQDLLKIDRETPIPNASLTRFRLEGGTFVLDAFADTRAVDAAGAPVTREESHRGRGHESA